MTKADFENSTPSGRNGANEYTEKQVLKMRRWNQDQIYAIHEYFNFARQLEGVNEPTIKALDETDLKITIDEIAARMKTVKKICPNLNRAIAIGMDPMNLIDIINDVLVGMIDDYVQAKRDAGETNSKWESLFNMAKNLPPKDAVEALKDYLLKMGYEDMVEQLNGLSDNDAYRILMDCLEDMTASDPD